MRLFVFAKMPLPIHQRCELGFWLQGTSSGGHYPNLRILSLYCRVFLECTGVVVRPYTVTRRTARGKHIFLTVSYTHLTLPTIYSV